MFNQQMQKLLKGAVEGELSLARDHPLAFPKIDETRNTQGPLNFPHTLNAARLTCLLSMFSERHSCLGVFLNICHAANS
jgi:hypothetical protein